VCRSLPVEAGFVLAMQTAGDCVEARCDGDGGVESVAVDDPAANDNPCVVATCADGVGSTGFVSVATTCGTGLVCDGAGSCVQCLAAADCPGVDDDCNTRTCVDNTCGISFSAQGTGLATQTPNDCQQLVCDGAGGSGAINNNNDLPAEDNNECTTGGCNQGTPTQTNVAAGTQCNTDHLCDGAGACVECLTPNDCPATNNECLVAACGSGGACENDPLSIGTVTPTQTPGNCQQTQCDGAGGTIQANDDNDLPADEPNPCTTEKCSNGTPVHENRPTGTPCGTNQTCDGGGNCI